MSIQIKIPPVGESITEVTIAQWLKKEGEYVEMDEVICELESEKATFELNAEQAGILHIKAKEGDVLEIGAIICEIEPADKKSTKEENAPEASIKTPPSTKPQEQPQKTGQTIEMKVPEVGESITEVTIGAWLKKDGDLVTMDEDIAEIESEKATFELTAEATGILKIIAKEGDTISIGDTLCKIEVMEGATPTSEPSHKDNTPTQTTEVSDTNYAKGHPAPAAAKILAEKGIDSSQVQGTGKGGRITKEDALKANTEESAASSSKPIQANNRSQRRKKLSSLRKTIARRLVSVKNETAMLTTFNEVDMKPIMDLRKKYKDQFKEKYQVGLGFMSFFTKAVCLALEEWPAVNAMIDNDEIVYNDYCDISIAVSTPRGLVVPVIRNAESLSFDQIEKQIIELATKARDNKLSIEEMTGGTFTITNGGVFGSMISTPIINAPQSAILGMHNIVERPVVVNGEVTVRPIMYVALSYDHRIIDGRESVSFLARVKQLLEDPSRLLLGI